MGPQHPATHGTLRLIARLDGEQVTSADVMCGYMHRGYEKLCEVRTYPQITTLVNRIDWLGSFANEVPFILAAEQLMEVEAPPRARKWIRTILFELSRIANVSLFIGDLALQLGAQTPAFYAFRDREFVLNQIEAVTGGRFHPNFDRIGGLKDDLPKGWIAETKAAMVRSRVLRRDGGSRVRQRDLPDAHPRHRRHPRCTVALSYGLSGANLRGSGVDWDLRRDANAGLAYDELDWKVVDPPRRRQLLAVLGPPPGGARGHEDRRPAARRPAQRTDHGEGPPHHQGARGRGLRADREPPRRDGLLRRLARATLGPFRVKIRSASFNNISVASWLLRGVYVPDIITILASLYFILGDIDR